MHWDFIVIGAGSAGCAAAYELVKAGRKVLLLEAGNSDLSPFIKIPAAVWSPRPYHDWGYGSQPDPTREGRSEPWRRGRVLGGTSSINGMVYVRGAAGDFDRWSEVCGGRGGWSAKEVMAIFRELEHADQMSPGRGRCGPVYVRTVHRPHPVTDAFVESAVAAGVPFNPDYNDATQEGVGYLQLTQRRGLRWSAADAFIRPIRRHKHFRLQLKAFVEKVEMDQARAAAVVYRRGRHRRRETARHIVVSAGVINTPKLLMLSGIGDSTELRRHGIETAIELPAVGRNLRDHTLLSLTYRSRVPTNNLTEGVLQKLGIAARYLRYQEGPIAAAYESAAFARTTPSAPVPDLQMFFAPIGWEKVNGASRLAPFPVFKVCIVHSHPASSGRIRLGGSDPVVPPLIECRLLENEGDVQALARGVDLVRAIMATPPIRDLVEEEIEPGSGIADDQALRSYIRGHAVTPCHPMGTCRMGAGPETVVEPDLLVRGTENLWIADASVFPDGISANLNAPCMMIGAKLGRQLARTRQ